MDRPVVQVDGGLNAEVTGKFQLFYDSFSLGWVGALGIIQKHRCPWQRFHTFIFEIGLYPSLSEKCCQPSPMNSWISLFTTLGCLFTLTGCDTPVQRAQKAKDARLLIVKRPAMAEKIIEDVVKLPEDKEPTMWEIAQTFPAYDWSINVFHRDGLTEEKQDHFLLKGD